MNKQPARSRLPDDASYWGGLSQRIVDEASPVIRAHRGSWGSLLERWAPGFGIAAAVAALLTVLWLPAPQPAPADVAGVDQLLVPQDQLGARLASLSEPPRAGQVFGVNP